MNLNIEYITAIGKMEAGIVGALVADARGHTTRAVDLLADAVRLAVHEGVRRPFVTMSGSHLAALFDRLRLLAPEHATVATDIIDDLHRAGRSPAAATAGAGLSEREVEVLRYLPTMLTSAQIAAELDVSVHTVKTHIRSIYRKLRAERRSEAVARAHDIGIL